MPRFVFLQRSLLLACSLMLAFPRLGSTQQSTLDSLEALLPTVANDTNKVELLNRVSYLYYNRDLGRLKAYAEEALALAENLGDLNGQGGSWVNIGNYYFGQADYDSALLIYQKALEAYQAGNRLRGEAKVYNNIGKTYRNLGQYPTAFDFLQKSLKMAEELQDDRLIVDNYFSMGNLYSTLYKYQEAIDRYLKALGKVDKTGQIEIKTLILNNIGLMYMQQDDYQTALGYLEKSLQLADSTRSTRNQVACYNSLGYTHYYLGNSQQALDYFDRSIAVCRDVPAYAPLYVAALQGSGLVYLKIGQPAEGVARYQQSLGLAKSLGLVEEQISGYLEISKGYAQMGDFRQAYETQRQWAQLKDSLFTQENEKKIAQLEANLEVEKKEAEISKLERDREQQALVRNFIAASLAATLLLGGLIVSRQRLKIKKDRLLLEKQAELSQKNEELFAQAELLSQQADQLKALDESKSRFFANISHEFRTPLTLILGPIEQQIAAAPATDRPQWETMHRNALRLQQLINQLLDLSRLEAGKMRVYYRKGDIGQFFQLLYASFESLAAQRVIDFRADLPLTPLTVLYDQEKWETIAYNLLSNAFKFTPSGGQVRLEVAYLDKRVRMTIADNGPGIPPEALPHVFDRFYQVDGSSSRAFEGSGIGLALTRELVELLGGQIAVVSEPGQGAAFTVTLPALAESSDAEGRMLPEEWQTDRLPLRELPAAPAISWMEKMPESSGKEVVLIVEDNPDLQYYLKEQLEPYYQVLLSANGQEGWGMAHEQLPDLILSDMMMPQMDGFELCRRIRASEAVSHVPFILLTARASVEDRLSGLELGADDYLTKPFQMRELLLKIRNLLESRRRLRERYGKGTVSLQPAEVAVTSLDAQFLQKTLAVMERYLADPDFSVEKMADELGMSRKTLQRKLSALTGQSPVDFIRQFRLQRAAQLLSQQAGNVGDVAFMVGFSNLSYFTKTFKELYGTTPGEYRQA